VLSGALAARRRRAFGTSSAAGDDMSTRRANTTLSSRPRPTAPVARPTIWRHCCAVGHSPSIASGASGGGVAEEPAGGASSAARRASRAHVRSSPFASAPAAELPIAVVVSHAPPPDWSAVSDGMTIDPAPNGAHSPCSSGVRPANPMPPSRIGPSPRTSAGRETRAPATSDRQAASASRKRSGPKASTDHARPMPTSANCSLGRSQSVASRPASTAAE
jgi:hypothetical protein